MSWVAPLRASARGATAAGWTAFMLAAVESHKAADRWLAGGVTQDTIFEAYMRVWTGGLLRLTRSDVKLGGLPPRAQGARLVVSNHRSALDIPLLITQFGGSVLSRGDIEKWPLLGVAARKAQTIFVDRSDSRSGAAAIRQIQEHLRNGRTVSVFPEGTTFPGDEVRPFNRGAFSALAGLDVEIVPVGIAYPPGLEYVEKSFLAHAQAIAGRSGTKVAMAAGEPLRSFGQKSADLAKDLRARVQAQVAVARKMLD